MLLQAPAPRPGNGTVTGTVVVAGTSEPIPDAEIVISTAAGLLEATTDSNGRFTLSSVPAGNHTVIVRAEGFFAAPATADAVPQSMAQVTVAVAQTGTAVSVPPLTMIRGAIITGKVVDPQGRPMPFATVQALRPGLGPAVQTVAARATDDQGEYRLFWVPPGEYLIGVNPRPPLPTNLAAMAALQQPLPQVVRTLFPSTTDVAQANKVTVKSGDEIRGIDIAARLDVVGPAARVTAAPRGGVKISGQITNALMPTAGTGVLLLGSEADPGQPRPAGSVLLNTVTVPFEIPSVPPGKYDLFVRMPDARGSVGAGGAQQAWGHTTVEVQDRDVEGVLMTIHPSVDVPGVLKIDGKAVAGGGSLKVGLSPMGPAGRIPNYRGVLDRAQTPGEDGKFAIPGAAEGYYDVFVQGAPATSYIADIRQGDSSILVKGINVGEVIPSTFEVLLATDGGTVEGLAMKGDKSPVSGAAIVLVPEDRQFIRLSKNATAGADGRFSIRGVRPGEYKVFAGPPGPAPAATTLTSEQFSKIEDKGVKVTVKPSATAKADVPLFTD
jgi:hypothetical protein